MKLAPEIEDALDRFALEQNITREEALALCFAETTSKPRPPVGESVIQDFLQSQGYRSDHTVQGRTFSRQLA